MMECPLEERFELLDIMEEALEEELAEEERLRLEIQRAKNG